MKNAKTNCILFRFIAVLIISVFSSIVSNAEQKKSHEENYVFVLKQNKATTSNDKYQNETYDFVEMVDTMFPNKSVETAEYLYNLDGSPDFVCAKFKDSGYAVFFEKTMELLECSLSSNLPSKEFNYYGGPGCFLSKNSNTITDFFTKKFFVFSKEELLEKSRTIRNVFEEKARVNNVETQSIKLNHCFENNRNDSFATGGVPNYDGNNVIILSDGNYISNYNYFLVDPIHGSNESNKCGAVAAQLLLSYNNYYSDRRIIPNNYLFGNPSNPDYNPNYCPDPMTMSPYTLGTISSGNQSDNYFLYLVDKIPGNATTLQVKNGINSVMNDRNSTLGPTETINFSLHYYTGGYFFVPFAIDPSGPIAEINSGRPLILLMQSSLGGLDHFVVGYGHGYYTYPGTSSSYNGFITHFGWGSEHTNVWINSAWCHSYITLKLNHNHNYNVVGQIGLTNRTEYKCTICNHRTDASIKMNLNTRYFETTAFVPQNNYLYKDYYFVTESDGLQLIQTFGEGDAELFLFNSEYDLLISNDDDGYLFNSFLWYEFEAGEAYVLRVSFPISPHTGTIKIGVTPSDTYLNDYEDIWSITSSTGGSFSWTSSTESTSLMCFVPQTSGVFQFLMSSLDNIDTYLYFIDSNSVDPAVYDDDSGGNYQAKIQANLTAYHSYLLIASAYNIVNSSGRMSLSIDKIS